MQNDSELLDHGGDRLWLELCPYSPAETVLGTS